MKTFLRRLVPMLLLSCLPAFGADLSGSWDLVVELSVGTGPVSLVVKQSGDKLTGTYTGTLGEAPLSGTVKGEQVVIVVDATYGGEKVKITYTGTLKTEKRIEGTAVYGSLGDGTFVGTKK